MQKTVAIAATAVATVLLGLSGWLLLTAEGDSDAHRVSAAPSPPEPAASVVALPPSTFTPRRGEAAGNYISRQYALAQDPAKLQRARDAELAQLERLHRAEPVDSAWKPLAERSLATVATSRDLEGSGIAPLAYDGDCRSVTCRISAQFTSNGDAQDWGNMLTTMSGNTLRQAQTTVIANPDGTFELRIYGLRK
jgi:hypothetical protein